MRKWLAFVLVRLFLVGMFAQVVVAEDATVDASFFRPENPLFGITRAWESARGAFIFSTEKKVAYYLALAQKRRADVGHAKTAEGREKAEKLHQEHIAKVTALVDGDATLGSVLAQNTRTLERVFADAPDEAKEGLARALNASQQHFRNVSKYAAITAMFTPT